MGAFKIPVLPSAEENLGVERLNRVLCAADGAVAYWTRKSRGEYYEGETVESDEFIHKNIAYFSEIHKICKERIAKS